MSLDPKYLLDRQMETDHKLIVQGFTDAGVHKREYKRIESGTTTFDGAKLTELQINATLRSESDFEALIDFLRVTVFCFMDPYAKEPIRKPIIPPEEPVNGKDGH